MGKRNISSAAQVKSSPARKILSRSPYRRIGGGKIPHLSDQEQHWESHNEEWAIPTLALCHDITSLNTQNVRIEYIDDEGKKRHTVIDIHCNTTTGKNLLIEVKSWKTITAGHLRHDLSRIRAAAQAKDYTYVLLVDLQLKKQPLRNRTDFLQRYLSPHDKLRDWERVVNYLKNVGTASLLNVSCNADLSYDQVCIGVARSRIAIELTHSYSPESFVSLPNTPFRRFSYADVLDENWSDAVLDELSMGGRNIDQLRPVAITPSRYRVPENAFSSGIT